MDTIQRHEILNISTMFCFILCNSFLCVCFYSSNIFVILSFFFFFFSSRRRHTRFKCDWSSDVCSSDLHVIHGGDGFYAAIDNVEPWIVYTESQDGDIDRRAMRTGQQRSIRPEAKAREPHYLFQCNSPVAVAAPQHTTIYSSGSNFFT